MIGGTYGGDVEGNFMRFIFQHILLNVPAALFVLASLVVGDGLRDVLDPRMGSR